MGALAALLNKDGEPVDVQILIMLNALKHRGNEVYGVASPASVEISRSIRRVADVVHSSNILLSYNFAETAPNDKPQPFLREDSAVVFEGRAYSSASMLGVEAAVEKLYSSTRSKKTRFLELYGGSYVFVVAYRSGLTVGRDRVGACPLYYGENKTLCGLASERKALWKIGLSNVKPFPPGNLCEVSDAGFSFHPARLNKPSTIKPAFKDAADNIKRLLLRSIRKRVSDLNEVAIAFSGGVDSSIITHLTKKCVANVHLVSVSVEDRRAVDEFRASADALRLPLHQVVYSKSDVEKTLPKVLWLIEEASPLQASIAIPFYWIAETASKLGFKVVLLGQGSDELFGGYRKYLEHYSNVSSSALQRILSDDFYNSYLTNFQRDNQVFASHKVEVRLPFTDVQFVNYVLQLPVKWKIASSDDALRKRILRKTALNIGIPPFIACKRKNAIQYTTGVSKALRKLANEKKMGLQEYTASKFPQDMRKHVLSANPR